MSNALLKIQRRKEQNRRAQANLRRKRQEQVEHLQQQVLSLKAQAQACAEQPQTPSVDRGNGGEVLDLENCYNSFEISTGDVPGYLIEDNLLLDNISAPAFNPFTSYVQQLPKSTYLSSSTAKSQVTPKPSCQEVTNSSQNAVPISQQYHCAFDALAKNASTLGISPESFLSTNSTSIFYSPLQSLTSIQESIKYLPSEFHPTMAQLSYPHQPWIDCIPLRDLRSRIIFAVSHRPPFLDSLDIWHDILSDGLSCAADPKDALQWTMSNDFIQRWQMLLRIDLMTLETMCLTSNPPVRKTSLSGV